MTDVWILDDNRRTSGIFETETEARKAAEVDMSEKIDKGWNGSKAEKRFQWTESSQPELLYYRGETRSNHPKGTPIDWDVTGFTILRYTMGKVDGIVRCED